jgi:hypothetical protein
MFYKRSGFWHYLIASNKVPVYNKGYSWKKNWKESIKFSLIMKRKTSGWLLVEILYIIN